MEFTLQTICAMQDIYSIAAASQSFCIDSGPHNSRHFALHLAIVCGVTLPPGSELNLFRQSGLYHLIVVSGGHLIFFRQIFEGTRWLLLYLAGTSFARYICSSLAQFIPLKFEHKSPTRIWADLGRRIVMPILFAYCLLTGLQPPIVRSVAGLLLKSFAVRMHVFIEGSLEIAFAGLFSLLLFPEWFKSLSLQLSWSASLALVAASTLSLRGWRHLFGQAIVVFLLVAYPLSTIAALQPQSIVFNFLMAPVIGAFLLPLCVVGFIFPSLVSISDPAIDQFLRVLALFSESSPLSQIKYTRVYGPWPVWIYILALHIVLFSGGVWIRRRHIR